MTDKRHGQEVPPSEARRRKAVEPKKTPETDVQLDLNLLTSADLDAILIELFD